MSGIRQKSSALVVSQVRALAALVLLFVVLFLSSFKIKYKATQLRNVPGVDSFSRQCSFLLLLSFFPLNIFCISCSVFLLHMCYSFSTNQIFFFLLFFLGEASAARRGGQSQKRKGGGEDKTAAA